jgi:hypothetical protein
MQLVDGLRINAQGNSGQLAQSFFRVRRGRAIFVGFGGRIRCAANFNRQCGQGQFEF